MLSFARKLDHSAAYCDTHANIEDYNDEHGTQEEEKSTELIHGPVRWYSLVQHGAEGRLCYLV
jgi:hypothetical protein